MEENYKKCISCGQSILAEAKICKHCRREQHPMSVQPEIKVSGETKKCIHCAEPIALEAKLCKHCRKWQVDEEEQQKKEEEQNGEAAQRFVGCFLILGLVFMALLHFTIPSEEAMRQKVADAAVDEMMSKLKGGASLLFGSKSNAFVDFFGGLAKEEMSKEFLNQNYIEVEKSWFWTKAYLYNDKRNGKSVAIGFLGMCFSTLDWEDFSMQKSSPSNHQQDSIANPGVIDSAAVVDSAVAAYGDDYSGDEDGGHANGLDAYEEIDTTYTGY